MTRPDPLRSKALACLREGRVTVYDVTVDDKWRITHVLARVLSSRDRHPYCVELADSGVTCDCRSGLRGETCAHALAVALVTTTEALAS